VATSCKIHYIGPWLALLTSLTSRPNPDQGEITVCRYRESRDRGGYNEPGTYQILTTSGQAEIKVQRSRFLAKATPARTRFEAKRAVTETVKRYHDCRHVCFAWRGGAGSSLQENRNDGGEPAGTAGEPILAAIRQAEVTDCVVVVARYFGGIKLGTGGLSRAYNAAATAALESAEMHLIQPGREFTLCFPYSHQKTVANLLRRHNGRTVTEKYTTKITWTIWLPDSRWRAYAIALSEATAGEVTIKAPA
jgi:uncharacterized YigZ family protein